MNIRFNFEVRRILNIAITRFRRIRQRLKRAESSVDQTLKAIQVVDRVFSTFKDRFYSTTFPAQSTPPHALALYRSISVSQTNDLNPFIYRLTGHAKGHYSLAIVNRALATALFRHSGGQTLFVPFDGEKNQPPHQFTENLMDVIDRDLHAVINNAIPTATLQPVVSIVHHYPVITDESPADIRLIVFFWEESTVPADTVSLLNEKFDGILVAAEFVALALRNSGCAIPIFVVPLGMNHLVDYSEPLLPLQTVGPSKPFRFLHVSSVFDRKGPEFLLAAFFHQFDADDNVELYIKTFPNPHNQIHQLLACFYATKKNPPRVIIDETDATKEALQSIYRSAHTLVLPTRGEGFNLPAAEALALGLPVIVTGFGAHTDFCTTQTALLIPFHFDFSQSHVKTSESCWVTPDTRSLSYLLQQSVDEVMTRSEALQRRREAGYALMRSTYTWDQSAKGIENVSKWLTRNRLDDQSRAKKLSIKIIQCESLDTLASPPIDTVELDALIIQLDGDRIRYDISETVLNNLSKLRRQIIIIFELTSAIDDDFLRSTTLVSIQAFIKRFDRVFVRTLSNMNLMLGSGIVRNVVLIPDPSDEKSSQETRNQRIQSIIKGLIIDRQVLND